MHEKVKRGWRKRRELRIRDKGMSEQMTKKTYKTKVKSVMAAIYDCSELDFMTLIRNRKIEKLMTYND